MSLEEDFEVNLYTTSKELNGLLWSPEAYNGKIIYKQYEKHKLIGETIHHFYNLSYKLLKPILDKTKETYEVRRSDNGEDVDARREVIVLVDPRLN